MVEKKEKMIQKEMKFGERNRNKQIIKILSKAQK